MAHHISRLALIAVSDHSRAQECANFIIQHGIDSYHAFLAANAAGEEIYMSGAGWGNGRYFSILFASKLLNQPGWLTTLGNGWAGSGNDNWGGQGGSNPDDLGEYVGKFWETTSAYYSTAAHSTYDSGLPKARSSYPNSAVPLYGDANADSSYGGSNKLPSKQWDAANQPLVTARGSGNDPALGIYKDYMWRSVPAAMGEYLATCILGWRADYPAAMADLLDRFATDDRIVEAALPGNAGQFDIDRYGGTGNEFIKDMWETYRGQIV